MFVMGKQKGLIKNLEDEKEKFNFFYFHSLAV